MLLYKKDTFTLNDFKRRDKTEFWYSRNHSCNLCVLIYIHTMYKETQLEIICKEMLFDTVIKVSPLTNKSSENFQTFYLHTKHLFCWVIEEEKIYFKIVTL